MNVIAGRAGLIAGGKLTDEDIRHSAATIKSEADRITKIVRNLLDFARRTTLHRSSQIYIGGSDPAELVSLEEIERRYIMHVLATVSDNKTLAARILGLDRKTLYRKLKHYGVAAE